MESRTDSQMDSPNLPDWALVGQQYTADDVKGFTQVLTTLGPLAALWYAVPLSTGVSLWLTAAATVLMMLFLIRGFVLLHECGHASLFRTPWLNRAFGFVFGVMAGMPQFVWSKHHAYHHATNGNWSKYTGPLNTRSVDEFRALTPGQQRKYESARDIRMAPFAGFMYLIFNPRITWLVGSVKLVVHVLKGMVAQPGVSWRTHAAGFKTPYWNDAREYWHMFWNNVVLLSVWAAMSWWIGPALFFSVYLASVTVAGGIVIVLFSVQHNFEHSYASGNEGWDIDAAAIHGTSFLVLPRWLHWFTANIAYHHIHHLSARIPNYCLIECHARYQHLFSQVRRIRLSELPAAMKHILWDVQARRIISVAEFRRLEADRLSYLPLSAAAASSAK
jgi:omega-6 fatty acid desaturase (delta-12 desaturase)